MYDIVSDYYNTTMYYILMYVFIAMSDYSKASCCDQKHPILLLYINTFEVMSDVWNQKTVHPF